MAREASQLRRIARELKTVRAMIGIYCRAHHQSGELCEECGALWAYAQQRVDHCPFGTEKPTCRNCTVHCYKPAMREQIRVVMRFSGPRMTWRHPILALAHVIDGRRAPEPRRSSARTTPIPNRASRAG